MILGLRDRAFSIRLVCWGENSRLIRGIRGSGISVYRMGWRWGCRWGLPDKLLAGIARRQIRGADVVVFAKLMPSGIHNWILGARRGSSTPRFVFVTPYRPAEMWAGNPPPRPLLNSLDLIVVQAGIFAEDLRAMGYDGRISVLPYVPPACAPLAALPPGPLRVGFLGRLVPQKNLPYLFEAIRILNHTDSATLDVFGDGSERERLATLARELGIGKQVRFHGAIAPEDVPAAVDGCHLFAFSSLAEGQCLAALEILARGRPLVATPVGAFPEILKDVRLGLLAPPDAAQKFAEQIGGLWQRMRSGAVVAAEVQSAYRAAYDRETVLRSYAGLFHGLVSRNLSAS